MDNILALVSELRRRNIFRAALLYIVSAWLLFQLTDIAAGLTSVAWVSRFTLAMLVICFPLAIIFSWIYEITPEGLKKEKNVIREQSITGETGRKLNQAILITLAVDVILSIARSFIA